MSEWWVVVSKQGRIEEGNGDGFASFEFQKNAEEHARWCDKRYPGTAPHRAVLVTEKGSEAPEHVYAYWRDSRIAHDAKPWEPELRGRFEACEEMLTLLGLLPEFRERTEREGK